ncbi:O-antigen ligase family protein [Cellulophaga sp. HaHaR_3_176]|uniref:O-antigen ligase family protein n=1 Tax=Cellulophaga sp. HaHaR_3_176 TaxID=1942464 RepID=UPI001C1F4890|nr:O-antigen ligase family protein [Cellulophaga sp. HaHaR_3_176]QWX84355.1 O-antigen ligase family protein [Cellulophaga sp. HaHaR_3_176]
MDKNKILLIAFVSFLIMNAITYNLNIFILGKYGKLLVAILGILMIHTSKVKLKAFFTYNRWVVFFWLACVLFTLVNYYQNGFSMNLFQNNILFIVFLYFYFLLSSSFFESYKFPNFYFLKYLSYALNSNLIIWTVVALILPFKIWHTLEDRTGLGLFYENYLQLGIFACVGAIANFSVYKFIIKKQGKVYFAFFLVYAVLVFLSNSRNVQLILTVFVLLNYVPKIKELLIKNVYLISGLIVVLSLMYFTTELLLTEDFTQFTTGRSAIWYYIFDYFSKNSIFIGKGIFGLNETILATNIDSNYYFQRLEFLYFHSSYIEVLCASGLIGFILFGFAITVALKKKKNFYYSIILISILLGALFESFLVQPTILLSFLFWYFMVSKDNYKNIIA